MAHACRWGTSVAAAVATLCVATTVAAAFAATAFAAVAAQPHVAIATTNGIATGTTIAIAAAIDTSVRRVTQADVQAAIDAAAAARKPRPVPWSRTPSVNTRVLRLRLEAALRHVPFTNVAAVAREWLRATATFPVNGGKVSDFYNLLLVNATNPATHKFYGLAAAVVYKPYPLKQPVALYIFRGGRYVNRGRQGVANVAFLGCHAGARTGAAARAITFVPPERCSQRMKGAKKGAIPPQ
ncbi:hypothetical protein MMPV_008977 [Pyropia vietnamensis]